MSPRFSLSQGPGFGRALSASVATLLVILAVTWGPPRERFHGMFESEEALTRAFLEALEDGDRERLASLALSKDEFQKEAFPEMPAYPNIPEDFVWDQLRMKSHYGLSVVLHYQGGRAFDFQDITYHGGQTAYDTFVVHRKPTLHLRDRKTGKSGTIVLFGSILEHEGRFKLFSLNIDR
jgi:hypothetical protein